MPGIRNFSPINRPRIVIAATACAVLALAATASAQSDIVLKASDASVTSGRWTVTRDTTTFEGTKIHHPDGGDAKIVGAVESPTNYFELTFTATAGVPYRLWLHGHADGHQWANDSVFVQFSESVTALGEAVYRIGTTSATEVNLEECRECGLKNRWVWQDNGWGRGVLGPAIYFATTGAHTLRVQTREDGLSIDQIVLSPSTYLESAPRGDARNGDRGAPDELRALDWNIHHGVGTDGDYDIERIASRIAATGANVVSLNEVERYTGWGNEDQPARFAALLESMTGKPWHYNFAQRTGNSTGQGNLLLTTFEIESEDDYELSYSRSVARIAILVNGVRVNLYSTHLDDESSTRRSTQIQELMAWANNYPEQRVILGDFNARAGTSEIARMRSDYADAWAVARNLEMDVAYSGNSAGNTRRSRIDYAFYSKNASRLELKRAQVFDTRDSSGVMPSDHRPLMTTFEVR
jgi:endonuclease/exonuclease/phosphatase family metal-dependent hydrolase